MTDETDRTVAPSLDGTMPLGWRERSSKPETHPRQRIVKLMCNDWAGYVAVLVDETGVTRYELNPGYDLRMWRIDEAWLGSFLHTELPVIAEQCGWNRKAMYHTFMAAIPLTFQHRVRKSIGKFVNEHRPHPRARTPRPCAPRSAPSSR